MLSSAIFLGLHQKSSAEINQKINDQYHYDEDIKFTQIALGGLHSAGITSEGRIYTWGYNDFGQLGDGTTIDKYIPTVTSYYTIDVGVNSLPVSEEIKKVSLGRDRNSAALTIEGNLYIWGDNHFGQIGDGTTIDRLLPTKINDYLSLVYGEDIIDISLSGSHSMALTSKGRVFTWGYNGGGILGYGHSDYDAHPNPTEITHQFTLNEEEVIEKVVSGHLYSIVLTSESRMLIWGSNSRGELGIGTSDHDDHFSPIDITSHFSLGFDEVIVDVLAGDSHTAVITSEGRIFTWGYNTYGNLGDGTTTDKNTPTDITNHFSLFPGEKIVKASVYSKHSAAVTSLGRVFTWGYNAYGQLGDGTTETRLLPIEITNQINISMEDKIINVQVGNGYSGVITSEGRIFTWGLNSSGKLGDGTHVNKSIPTEITFQFNLNEGEFFKDLILAEYDSSAVTSEGRIFTWGENSNGQLGDGTTETRISPIEINKLFKYYNKILLTYSENEQNQLSEKIKVSIFPEYEITDEIEIIKINGINYTSIIVEDGRIDVLIDNIWDLGDSVNLSIDEIVFSNAKIMALSGDTSTTFKLVEDIWAPEITFDYTQDFIIENNLGDESYLFAEAIDDTGEIVEYTIEGFIDWNTPGTYNLTYTATDFAGNTAVKSREIIVMPSIIEEGQQFQEYSFYYFLDDIVDEDLDLSNITIRYNNQSYSPINDPNGIKYIEGKNIIPFEFDIQGTTIIVSKDIYLTGNDDVPPTFDTIEDQLIEMGVEDIDWTEYIFNAQDNIPYGRLTKVEFGDQVDYQNLGTYSVTVKLIDAFGNETTQTFEVTVQDTTAPTFDFIPNQIIESGQDNFDWTTFIKNVEDNSFQDVIVEEKVDTVDYNTPGEYFVTVTASDVHGNIKEHTFNVYVQDTIAPTVNMEKSYTIEAANQDIDWTKEIISFTDNSDGPIYAEEVIDLVSYDSPGFYIVTILVYDSYGNENTQDIEITIVDTTAPTINGTSNYEYVLETNLPDYLAGITATDIVDGELTAKITVDDSAVIYNQVGRYPVTYQVTDSNGNTAEETIEVFVKELIPPVITLSGDESEVVELGEDYVQVGGTCTDNFDDVCTVTMQGFVDTSQVGEYTTVYTATDESGNTTTITRTVTVVDTTPPELSLNPMDSTVPINAVLEETGVSIDDLSTTTMIIDSDLDITTAGTYTIIYTVTDNSGNSSAIERIIHVYEPEPEVQFHLEDALTTIEVGSTYEDPGCTATIDGESFNCSLEDNTVDTAIAGFYTITYSVEYNGETYTYNRYVFVYDVDEDGQQSLYYRKEEEVGVLV